MSTKRSKLAILGAGPTGLEAALAARAAGLDFTLYEVGEEVAGHVRDWGHVELFSPWAYNISPRARAALAESGVELPPEDDRSCPTGSELVERLLQPLSRLDGVRENLRTGTRVVSVGREGLLKHEEIASTERGLRPFRLLLSDRSGREWVESADAVIDCTGAYCRPNALGDGGIPAPGEAGFDAEIVRRIPDLDAEPDAWAKRRILLVGAGHSALTAASALASLGQERPGTEVTWALRSEQPDWPVDPEDPLPGRSALALRGRELLAGSSAVVKPVTGVVVESLERSVAGIAVVLRHRDGTLQTIEVDRVLALTGSVGNHDLYRQLQIHECYATLGPMKLSAALLGAGAGADCLAQESLGADTLKNPEPAFFILGAKSYGRNSSFLMRLGWQQVDEVFELLGAGAPGGALAVER